MWLRRSAEELPFLRVILLVRKVALHPVEVVLALTEGDTALLMVVATALHHPGVPLTLWFLVVAEDRLHKDADVDLLRTCPTTTRKSDFTSVMDLHVPYVMDLHVPYVTARYEVEVVQEHEGKFHEMLDSFYKSTAAKKNRVEKPDSASTIKASPGHTFHFVYFLPHSVVL